MYIYFTMSDETERVPGKRATSSPSITILDSFSLFTLNNVIVYFVLVSIFFVSIYT